MVFDLFFYCVTVKTIYTVNQSKVEVITCSSRETRGNECERVKMGVVLAVSVFLRQSWSARVKMKSRLLFETGENPLYQRLWLG